MVRRIITPNLSNEAKALLGLPFIRWMEEITGLLTGDFEGAQTGFVAMAEGISSTGAIEDAGLLPPSVVLQSSVSTVTSGSLLKVHDEGANATITVQTHTRSAAGTAVTVNGGGILGLAYLTLYYIYYDDPTGKGGDVTFLATTSAVDLTANAYRVSLGALTTLDSGDPDVDLGGEASTGGLPGSSFTQIQ